jgi:hypothetical protein
MKLKSLWKKIQFKLAANDIICPPPEPVRQEMEEKGWKYKVTVLTAVSPAMLAPPVAVTPTTSDGIPVMSCSCPELYDKYRKDLRESALKVYGPT